MALSVRPAKRSVCVRIAPRWCAAALFVGLIVAGATSAQAATNKRIAVLMFKPQNYGTQWVDAATVRAVVWTGLDSADEYYREESFGRWALTGALRADGDIFGWYTVPYNDVGTCTSSINTWAAWAKAQAAAQGYVDSNYDALIYVTAASNCPGRAFTSGRTVTVISGFNPPTLEHELGHAFGLNHAAAWSCKDASGVKVPISSSCGVMEYGDFAVMGQTTHYHMNNFMKGALGWLVASNTKDVTIDGVYALYPIEQATTYVQVLRIPRTFDAYGTPIDYYYLEFRQPFGFDDFPSTYPRVTGISIRVGPPYTRKNYKSYLLDATTPNLTGFNDAELPVGATFTDPARRVNITLLSIVGGSAQVLIDFF